MRKIILMLLLATPCLASGPKYGFTDPKLNDELENNYKDHEFPNWVNARGSTATITYLNVSTMNVTGNLVASSGTIRNLTASSIVLGSSLLSSSKIFQVVVASFTAAATTTASTFQGTSFTTVITPTSSSSKILFYFQGEVNNGAANKAIFVTVTRGGSNLGGSNGMQALSVNPTGSTTVPCTILGWDSPATTSATTYALAIKNNDGATTVQLGDSNQVQYLILVEFQ